MATILVFDALTLQVAQDPVKVVFLMGQCPGQVTQLQRQLQAARVTGIPISQSSNGPRSWGTQLLCCVILRGRDQFLAGKVSSLQGIDHQESVRWPPTTSPILTKSWHARKPRRSGTNCSTCPTPWK